MRAPRTFRLRSSHADVARRLVGKYWSNYTAACAKAQGQTLTSKHSPSALWVFLAFLGATSILGAQSSQSQSSEAGANSELHIVILQGEGAVNNIKQRTARELIVRVEDENKRPVGGAAVAFVLPPRGPGAEFAHGSKVLTLVTDQSGRAATSALKLNRAVGVFRINVTASFHGHVAAAVIGQTNALAGTAATASSAGGAAGSSGAGGGGGAAGSGTAAGAGTGGTAAGGTAGAAGGAGAAGAAGAGAAAGGISAVTVVAIAGGVAAAGVVVGKVATSSNGSSTPPSPTATIGTPGSPVIGPELSWAGGFATRHFSGTIAGVTKPKTLANYAFSVSKSSRPTVLAWKSPAVYTFFGRLANAQLVRFAAAHISIRRAAGAGCGRCEAVLRIVAK